MQWFPSFIKRNFLARLFLLLYTANARIAWQSGYPLVILMLMTHSWQGMTSILLPSSQSILHIERSLYSYLCAHVICTREIEGIRIPLLAHGDHLPLPPLYIVINTLCQLRWICGIRIRLTMPFSATQNSYLWHVQTF